MSEIDSNAKLILLAENEGYDTPTDMIKDYEHAGAVPGICMNPDCDYAETIEPDGDEGYCEECETYTVKSCFLIAGLI